MLDRPRRSVCGSSYLLESSFISRITQLGRGRVRIQSSNGRSYNSVQRINFHQSDFSFDKLLEEDTQRKLKDQTQGFFSLLFISVLGALRLGLLSISFSLFNFWKSVVVN
ncbi:hypothetical protein Sjap_003079 [Stephania japonica]|uniref:Uncharacterized protein n=1 Tax=Stephania japonica TaxID=461633 RepID=A0AAP0KPT9_9MAGN